MAAVARRPDRVASDVPPGLRRDGLAHSPDGCARAVSLVVRRAAASPPARRGRSPGRGASACAPCRFGRAKVLTPVAAVGGAEYREQRLVLVDRQQLAVAERPARGREVERDELDLADERFAHMTGSWFRTGTGRCPPCAMMKLMHQERRHVVVRLVAAGWRSTPPDSWWCSAPASSIRWSSRTPSSCRSARRRCRRSCWPQLCACAPAGSAG